VPPILNLKNDIQMSNKKKMPNELSAGGGIKPHVRRSTVNKYKCPRCQRLFKRNDERQWIKSYCTATDGETRLIIQK